MTSTTSSGIETARVAVSDGSEMLLHVARPAASRPNGGAVIVLQEAYGVNGWLGSVASRFAELGLLAVAPELYHRSGDGSVLSYDAQPKDMEPLRKATTPEGFVADIRATYDWLLGNGETKVDGARVAAVGFCMGGRVAYLANASVPLAAAISFYGGSISAWFDLLPKQHGPLLMLWGAKDHTIDRAQQRGVADAFDEAGLVHTQVVFSEAKHGFFRHTRADVSEPRAASQAWVLSLEFLRQNGVLPASAATT